MTRETVFRRKMREMYPGVRFTVRTISFEDLARTSAKCLDIQSGLLNREIHGCINAWAREAGIVPDTSVRFDYGFPAHDVEIGGEE